MFQAADNLPGFTIQRCQSCSQGASAQAWFIQGPGGLTDSMQGMGTCARRHIGTEMSDMVPGRVVA